MAGTTFVAQIEMKSFIIKDRKLLYQVLDEAEFGTLALCLDNNPYSLPLNFVRVQDEIYFHGKNDGRKMEILRQNKQVSFSVVESYSLIPSYFSSNAGLACSATIFFKSVLVDGTIEAVTNYNGKKDALSAFMNKYQPEGGYTDIAANDYKKIIDKTVLFSLSLLQMQGKFKFGQHLTQDSLGLIIKHLEERNQAKDKATIAIMKSYMEDNNES